jgi:hypothetical protein
MPRNRHHRRQPLSGETLGLIAAVIVLAVAAGAGIVYIFQSGDSDPGHRDEIAAAQDLVRAKLGGQIYFRGADETSFESLEDGKVHVSGTLDVMPPDGRTISYSYSVRMHLDSDAGWITDDISLVPL